jgi:DNA repair/transcription protein MET18/MMS19
MTDVTALKDMGTEFLNSYTKMVDGEKDPRNLMLLFSMARVILVEFDVEPQIEVRTILFQTSPIRR